MSWSAACSGKWIIIETKLCPFIYIWSIVIFLLQWQSLQSYKRDLKGLNYLLSGLLQRKFSDSWSRVREAMTRGHSEEISAIGDAGQTHSHLWKFTAWRFISKGLTEFSAYWMQKKGILLPSSSPLLPHCPRLSKGTLAKGTNTSFKPKSCW